MLEKAAHQHTRARRRHTEAAKDREAGNGEKNAHLAQAADAHPHHAGDYREDAVG